MPIPLFIIGGIRAATMAYRMWKFRHPSTSTRINKYGGAFGWGLAYAGGTNVGYNMFNEYVTPFMRGSHYVGRPQYVNRL